MHSLVVSLTAVLTPLESEKVKMVMTTMVNVCRLLNIHACYIEDRRPTDRDDRLSTIFRTVCPCCNLTFFFIVVASTPLDNSDELCMRCTRMIATAAYKLNPTFEPGDATWQKALDLLKQTFTKESLHQ